MVTVQRRALAEGRGAGQCVWQVRCDAEGGRERVGCWAHARRKFRDARTSAPEVNEVLALITRLYRVEHKAAELGILGTEAHGVLRDEQSRAILTEINA